MLDPPPIRERGRRVHRRCLALARTYGKILLISARPSPRSTPEVATLDIVRTPVSDFSAMRTRTMSKVARPPIAPCRSGWVGDFQLSTFNSFGSARPAFRAGEIEDSVYPGERQVGCLRARLRARARDAATAFRDSGWGQRAATVIRGHGSDRPGLSRIAAAHHRCCHLPRIRVARPCIPISMSVPGTAADVSTSYYDSISTVPGTGPRVRFDALTWTRPLTRGAPRGSPL